MFQNILKAYNLSDSGYHIEPLGSGLINKTWKVFGNGGQAFVLQRINTDVFKNPEYIASNIRKIGQYLATVDPLYLFAAPLPASNGRYMVYIEGSYYRLSAFVPGSQTFDSLTGTGYAYEAAKQFGRFSRLLVSFDIKQLQYPLPDFHNLNLRMTQLSNAIRQSEPARLITAKAQIEKVDALKSIADTYCDIADKKKIPLRVIHHDAKINNVLFDKSGKGLCVIDLDTVMPGYFISDVGDMMRTYLAESNEEQTDMDKITIRPEFFAVIYAGYMGEMGDILTQAEKELFIYSGKFMIYMQAVRFLTDYLNGNIYYTTYHKNQNLVRTTNQLKLLEKYLDSEKAFTAIVNKDGICL